MFETLEIPSRDAQLFDLVTAIKPLDSDWCAVDRWEVREITDRGIYDITGYKKIDFHATPCHVRVERSTVLEMTTPDTIESGDAIFGYQYDDSSSWYSTHNPWIVHHKHRSVWYDAQGALMFGYGRPGDVRRVIVRRAKQRYANRTLAGSLATYLTTYLTTNPKQRRY